LKAVKIILIVVLILMAVSIGLALYFSIQASRQAANNSTNASTNTQTSEKMNIKVFLIANNDNGKQGKLVGCGDSVVAMEQEIPATTAVLKAAMEKLLSLNVESYPGMGLSNTLYASSLKIDSLSVANGTATIKLSGELKVNGTCDAPRIKAQLEETALQFSTVKKADIFINNKPINEVLSTR